MGHPPGLRGTSYSLVHAACGLYQRRLHGRDGLDLRVKNCCVPGTVDGAADVDEVGGVGQGDPTVRHQSRAGRGLSVSGEWEFHGRERRLPHVHQAAAAIRGIKTAPWIHEAMTLRIHSASESDIRGH